MIILISGKLVKIKPSVIPNLKSNCWLSVFCPYSVYHQTRYNAKIWLDRWWRFNEVILYIILLLWHPYMKPWNLTYDSLWTVFAGFWCHSFIIEISLYFYILMHLMLHDNKQNIQAFFRNIEYICIRQGNRLEMLCKPLISACSYATYA